MTAIDNPPRPQPPANGQLADDSRTAPQVEDIRHHYEVSNDFYRILLGETMMYSGGYWTDAEDTQVDLDAAQLRKLDRFIELAGASGARRVLDIGSGWGTMLHRLTTTHGVAEAIGVTLSRTQSDYATADGDPRVTVAVESWQDHTVETPYDAAFCINALEHFVLSSAPPRERLAQFRRFFSSCYSLLRSDGRLVLHMMTVEQPPLNRQVIADLKFLQREEFPGCYIPHLHELVATMESLFEVVEIRNEPLSFSRACRAWLSNLADRRDEAVALEGEVVVQRFERYLDIFAYTLEQGIFNNFLIVLRRKG